MAARCMRGAATPLTLVLATLLISTLQMHLTSAEFRLPEGAQDGIYLFKVVLEEGVEQQHVQYLGQANNTLGSGAAAAESPLAAGRVRGGGRKLLTDSGVHCQSNAPMNMYDVSYAVNGLANHFGFGGSYWYDNIGIVYGSAIAYACNYGGTQYTAYSMVWSDENAVTDACAGDVGGWYSHESWKSSFGRTPSGWGFC